MSWTPIGANESARWKSPAEAVSPDSKIPRRLRMTSTVLRAVFIASLLMVIVHVSMPESETIWRAYQAPGDLIRMALGIVISVWIAIQLFAVPKDAQGCQTWLYLGLAAVPFTLICMVGVW